MVTSSQSVLEILCVEYLPLSVGPEPDPQLGRFFTNITDFCCIESSKITSTYSYVNIHYEASAHISSMENTWIESESSMTTDFP